MTGQAYVESRMKTEIGKKLERIIFINVKLLIPTECQAL